jgi:hypothetical protein
MYEYAVNHYVCMHTYMRVSMYMNVWQKAELHGTVYVSCCSASVVVSQSNPRVLNINL